MSFQVLNLRPFRSGGYGNVYVGNKSDTREPVVVKYLRDSHIPHFRKGFEREVRLLIRQRPGMIRILAWDLRGDRPFYVMPYFNTGSLKKYAGRLTSAQLHAVACDLARTLANLHGANDVHGDIKPDNILVTDQGNLQVADPLGNGTLLTRLFSPNSGGTPGYIAPEIAAGGPISIAGDVYSYGETLHHLATGHVLNTVDELDDSLPGFRGNPEIHETIRACCQADPYARPSMKDVLRILEGITWKAIQLEQKQAQEHFGVVLFGGLLVLAGLALARDSG
jgi:serine/threonine protein kinase